MRFDKLAFYAFAFMAATHAPLPFRKASSSLLLVSAADEEAKIQVEKDTFEAPTGAESFKFEAEVSRMLDIVVNSLYQNKDVFLRELISNASDALDKIRFLALTKPEYLAAEDKLQVQIEFDKEHNTLTVRDTGIGMTHDEMVSNLGTVARSGTTKFLQALKGSEGSESSGDISQIGQFGVGFYSAFLVSDRVQVASKHPDSDAQYVWTSTNGSSEFQVYKDPRGETLKRGTEITLFLKEDCMEYADEQKLSDLAKHYSEFVVHPIYLRTETTMEVEVEDEEDVDGEEKKEQEDDLEVTDEEDTEATEEKEKPKKTKEVTTFDWEVLNGNPAIWTRPKEEISDEEYQNFYKVLTKNEYMDAETWTHFNAEGNINFKSILYVPRDVPASWQSGLMEQDATGLSLYVRKVLISDQFELLPRYLSFMKGVVDSDDLPLNVNRETLQESKIIQVIKKKVVRKALEMLKNFQKESDDAMKKEDEPAEGEEETPKTNKYNEWYRQFSPSLKMGAIEDEPNRGKIMKLLRFKSTTSNGELTTLEKYVENMKDWQKEIYFIAGDGVESVQKSHFLEPFIEKGVEVLYFVDPVDEYMAGHVRSFDSKNFKNIATDNVKLKDDEEDEDLITRREKFYKEKFKPLTKWLKKLYGPNVMRVSISKRLVSAPAIVSSAEFGHSANMERLMRAQAYSHGQNEFAMRSMKIFEINPRHPMIIKLLEGAPPEDADDDFKVSPEIEDASWVLYEMALLNGGFPISDAEGHSRRILNFLQSSLALESLSLEPHPELPVEEDVPPDVDGADFGADFDMDELVSNMNNLDEEDAKPKGTSPEDAIPLTPDENGNVHIEL
ncbi:heat shock protein Hsp90 [Nitzschia inconspicua]|uniref:Heat shock protein Hsp90 n=1 Tax=Nitzschia inconspicua TaxID=303405 RepID=A0A9K3LEF5_9STRA|nr:heat shock protein Hsp90 [Nitzschia inconspicua]